MSAPDMIAPKPTQSSLVIRLLNEAEAALRATSAASFDMKASAALCDELTEACRVPAPDGSRIVDRFDVLLAEVLVMLAEDLRGGGRRVTAYRQLIGVLVPVVQADLSALIVAQRGARVETTDQDYATNRKPRA